MKIAQVATQNNAELVQMATEISEECKNITDPNRLDLFTIDCNSVPAGKTLTDVARQ